MNNTQDALRVALEAKKLAPILRQLVEGGGEERDIDIYADDYQAADGDVFVTRAADLLDEIAALSAVPASEQQLMTDGMKAKAEATRKELQRIKDAPQDDEERALKYQILDGMSDPKLWEDGIAVMACYGAQEFAKGFRAALSQQAADSSAERKDAERYRWLKSQSSPGEAYELFKGASSLWSQWDRVIDAAIAAQSQPSEKGGA